MNIIKFILGGIIYISGFLLYPFYWLGECSEYFLNSIGKND